MAGVGNPLAMFSPTALHLYPVAVIRCDEPIAGEDLTYVLYGSGGCSLYDTAKLRALGVEPDNGQAGA